MTSYFSCRFLSHFSLLDYKQLLTCILAFIKIKTLWLVQISKWGLPLQHLIRFYSFLQHHLNRKHLISEHTILPPVKVTICTEDNPLQRTILSVCIPTNLTASFCQLSCWEVMFNCWSAMILKSFSRSMLCRRQACLKVFHHDIVSHNNLCPKIVTVSLSPCIQGPHVPVCVEAACAQAFVWYLCQWLGNPC